MIWNPGYDTDLNEGGDGADTVEVNGGNGAEQFTTTVTMDTDDVERFDVKLRGGADTLVVNDLSGTDVTDVLADLTATTGGDDGAADNVVVDASALAANSALLTIDGGDGDDVLIGGADGGPGSNSVLS